MANILPDKIRAELKRNFIIRVAIAYILATTASVCVGSALILPAFVISRENYSIIKAKEKTMTNVSEIESYSTLREEVRDINARIKRIKDLDKPLVLDAISKIVKVRTTDFPYITIRNFSFENSGENSIIRISGLAKGRNYLTDFVKALEKEEQFKQVVLPLSDFAKEETVFSITISL